MKSQQKTRALFLFPTDKMGGAENVTRMVAEAALKSNRFDEIILFVLSREKTGTLDRLAEDPRIKLVYSGAKSEKGGLLQLLSICMKQHYDLVFSSHTHVNAAASLMRSMSLLKTRRLVTRESTMIFERDMGKLGPLIRQLYRLYGGQDLVVCQTDRMNHSLCTNTDNRFQERVKTIANPIDLESIRKAKAASNRAKNTVAKEVRNIVWCGRLEAVKSPLRAIDTLAELHNSGYQNTHLTMIGDGAMKSEIIDYADSVGLADHVTLTGRLQVPAEIMLQCDLGLMTSDTEGFPNVILEMLASGVRCVVTTDCAGGLKDIPGVLVATEKTAESLASELATQLGQFDHDPRISGFLDQRDPEEFLRRLMA